MDDVRFAVQQIPADYMPIGIGVPVHRLLGCLGTRRIMS
jgi:hypothetical protein